MRKELGGAVFDFVKPGNTALNQVARAVAASEVDGVNTQRVIAAMLAIARGEQGDATRRTMVGLAAPQIGVGLRIILVAADADGSGNTPEDMRIYLNPEIVEISAEAEKYREGCFSTGNVCGVVTRAQTVKFRALDGTGSFVEQAFAGFPARIFQHEIDHLDGIRFPDKITNDNNLHWVEKGEYGKYRSEWRSWPVTCPRDRWESIKSGRIPGC